MFQSTNQSMNIIWWHHVIFQVRSIRYLWFSHQKSCQQNWVLKIQISTVVLPQHWNDEYSAIKRGNGKRYLEGDEFLLKPNFEWSSHCHGWVRQGIHNWPMNEPGGSWSSQIPKNLNGASQESLGIGDNHSCISICLKIGYHLDTSFHPSVCHHCSKMFQTK